VRRRVSREDAKGREEREDDDKKGLLILLLALAFFAFLRVFARIPCDGRLYKAKFS